MSAASHWGDLCRVVIRREPRNGKTLSLSNQGLTKSVGLHPIHTTIRDLDKNLLIGWKTSRKIVCHTVSWLLGELSWIAIPTFLWSAITKQRVYSTLKKVKSIPENMRRQSKLLPPIVNYRRNNFRLPGHAASTAQSIMPLAAHQPRAATIHSGPPVSLSRTSKQYILARRRPDKTLRASALHNRQRSSSTSCNSGTNPDGLIQHDHGTCR